MSSRKSKQKFCSALWKMVKDEKKAHDVDYLDLIKITNESPIQDYVKIGLLDILDDNRSDESKHWFDLNTAFNAICKRPPKRR